MTQGEPIICKQFKVEELHKKPVPVIDKLTKETGFEIDYDSDDMGDVVSELANIVAGDAIARLSAINIKAEISVPAVARGSDMELPVPDRMSSMRMNFAWRANSG